VSVGSFCKVNSSCFDMVSISAKNQLTIDFSPLLGFSNHLIIEPWENGFSWYSLIDGQVEAASWRDDPGLPLNMLCSLSDDWCEAIPKNIRNIVIALENKHAAPAFSALRLIGLHSHVYEVFESAPLLAWMLMLHGIENEIDEVAMVELYRAKRIRMLELLGFPPNKAALKFISKIKGDEIKADFIGRLRLFFQGVEWQKLVHEQSYQVSAIYFLMMCPKIAENRRLLTKQSIKRIQASGLLPVLNHIPELITLPLLSALFESGSHENWREFTTILRDTIYIGDRYAHPDIRVKILACRTFTELNALHDNLVETYLNREPELPLRQYSWMNILPAPCRTLIERVRMNFIHYPQPPYPGNAYIQPITNQKQLFDEGKSQHNCVITYHQKVMEGTYYVYKILAPERATVGVRLSAGKIVGIDQLRLAKNARPSDQTKAWVLTWLDTNQSEGSLTDE